MRLTVREPSGAERRVELGIGASLVGRDGDCDIVLADQKASRRHAVIEGGLEGTFTLRDLASTNGTSVDGRTIGAPVDLHDGESITIGRTTLTVDEPPEPSAEAGSAPHPSPARRRPRRTILLWSAGAAVALLVLVLVIAQFALPGIAAHRLRDSLSRHGTVQSVRVAAFPAITLLWPHADKVTVRMGSYGNASGGGTAVGGQPAATQPRSGPQRLADFLAGTSATDSLDARVGRLKVGRLALASVVVTKHGAEIAASAYASYGDIRAALPPYIDIRPSAGGGGELIFTGAASLFGRHASVPMRLVVHDGALVVQPDLGPFLPSVLSLTVFKDRRVNVEFVAAAAAPGGFDISARARLSGG
jgi:hypothetical protein